LRVYSESKIDDIGVDPTPVSENESHRLFVLNLDSTNALIEKVNTLSLKAFANRSVKGEAYDWDDGEARRKPLQEQRLARRMFIIADHNDTPIDRFVSVADGTLTE